MSDVDVVHAGPGDRVFAKGYRGRRVGWLSREGHVESTVLRAEVLELPHYPVQGGTEAQLVEMVQRMAEGTGMELVRLYVCGQPDQPEEIGALFV